MSDLPFSSKEDLENLLSKATEGKSPIAAKTSEKNLLRTRFLEELDEGTGRWNVLEDVLLDVQVAFHTELILGKLDKLPSVAKHIEALKQELDRRYVDRPEVLELLHKSIPSVQSISKWFKKPDWKEELDKRLKSEDLFSQDKRAKMIQMLYSTAMASGNMKAAEMWLKMSGDLKPQGEDKSKDKTFSEYEEFQKALWKKKQ
jgi:hypothetical protein